MLTMRNKELAEAIARKISETIPLHQSIPVQGLFWPLEEVAHIPEPRIAESEYSLPIDSNGGIHVGQGPLNARLNRTHSHYPCIYAIDLASPETSPPGKIIAARRGLVVNRNVDAEGGGFGNWVGILHEDGEISLYAHLQEVHAKIGQIVEQGQVIGVEGDTGLAGIRHLHFSVHRSALAAAGKIDLYAFDVSTASPPYLYQPIPYRLLYSNQNERVVTDIREFRNLDWDRDLTKGPTLFR